MKVVAALSVLVCCACAPLGSLRPASAPAAGRGAEVGAGAAVVSPRELVEEPVRAAGQLWALTRAGGRFTLSAIGAFDDDAVALGVAARFDAIDTKRFAGGVELELGYAWAAVSLPVAVRMFGESWAYGAPRFGSWGTQPLLSLPAGVSLHAGDGVFLRAEGQALIQSFAWGQPRWAAGLGAAYQLPAP